MSAVPPQLSLYLLNFCPEPRADSERMVRWAEIGDAAGVDRIVVSEHVAFGERLEAYGDPSIGGIRGGTQPTGPDGAWLDPLATIAYLSGRTSRARLATRVLLAALRSPVILAKTAATIDVLSGGRLEIGVGVGWQREEYEATGTSFDDRGRLLDRNLGLCQALWRDRAVSHTDDRLTFSNIHQMPKPLQPGGIPIWVSGTVNRRSMDRLARYGNGWIPWGDDLTDVARGIGRMRAAVEARGRGADGIGVTAPLPIARSRDGAVRLEETIATAVTLRQSGVSDFMLHFDRAQSAPGLAADLAAITSAFRAAVI